ncbi:MAG: tetratricopeptide repeat protein [Methanopyri archaeon]|jgi:tetratricopeptide (TPR) repeat protein|nr:tetratricopeptide repeat protein [Methanopyri archaeon]
MQRIGRGTNTEIQGENMDEVNQVAPVDGEKSAYKYYRDEATKDTTYAKTKYVAGQDFLSKQDYPKAIEAFQAAVGLTPEFIEAWIALGNAFIEAKKPLDAINALNNAIQLDSQSGDAWYLLGRAYYNYGAIKQTVTCYKQATALDPTFLPYNLYDEIAQPWFRTDLKRKIFHFLMSNDVLVDEFVGQLFITMDTWDIPTRTLLGVFKVLIEKGRITKTKVATSHFCDCYGVVSERHTCPSCGCDVPEPSKEGYSACPSCQTYIVPAGGVTCMNCKRAYPSIKDCHEKNTYRFALNATGEAMWIEYSGQVRTGMAIASVVMLLGAGGTVYAFINGLSIYIVAGVALIPLGGFLFVLNALYRIQIIQKVRRLVGGKVKGVALRVTHAIRPRANALADQITAARHKYFPTPDEQAALEAEREQAAKLNQVLSEEEKTSATGAKIMALLFRISHPFDGLIRSFKTLHKALTEEEEVERDEFGNVLKEEEMSELQLHFRRIFITIAKAIRPITEGLANLNRDKTEEELEMERMKAEEVRMESMIDETQQGPTLLKRIALTLGSVFAPVDKFALMIRKILTPEREKTAEEIEAEAEMAEVEEEESGFVAQIRGIFGSLTRSLVPLRDALYKTFRRRSDEEIEAERLAAQVAGYGEGGESVKPKGKTVSSVLIDILGKLLKPVDIISTKLTALSKKREADEELEGEDDVDPFFQDKDSLKGSVG